MRLDHTDEETLPLLNLSPKIENDRYPLSPRIQNLPSRLYRRLPK